MFFIPFAYRNAIRDAGVLNFSERVSLYPLALLLLPSLQSCNAAFISILVLLILLLFRTILRAKEGDSGMATAFNSGLILALGILITPLFAVMLIPIWIGLSAVNTLNWRTIVWSFLGVFGPVYLLYAVGYLSTGTILVWPWMEVMTNERSLGGEYSWSLIVYIAVMVGLIVLMVQRSIRALSTGVAKRRRLLRLGLWTAVCAGILSAMLYQFSGVKVYISLASVPLGVLFLEFQYDKSTRWDSLWFVFWLAATWMLWLQ